MNTSAQEHPDYYYRHERGAIYDRITQRSCRKILDIGCGEGFLGANLLRTQTVSEVVGIEVNEDSYYKAKDNISRVYVADLNIKSVGDVLPEKDLRSFDCIICADVLEHLIDPWGVLNTLCNYVKPGGRIILSLPNVRHWKVIASLAFRGTWQYADKGIMDRTHLRFFTRSTLLELVSQKNFQTLDTEAQIGGHWISLNRATFGLLSEFLAIQWHIEMINTEK